MVDTKNVVDRLIKFLNSKSIPFARMERMAGFSNGYLRNNKGNMPGTRLAEVIECFPELNGDWLLTGRGEMLLPTDDELKRQEDEKKKEWEAEYVARLKAAAPQATIIQTGSDAVHNEGQGSNATGGEYFGRDKVVHQGPETEVLTNGDDNKVKVLVVIDDTPKEVSIEELRQEYIKLNKELKEAKASLLTQQTELLTLYREYREKEKK